MPKGTGGSGSKKNLRWLRKGVEAPETVTSDDLILGGQILHIETKWVKFNRARIIRGKLMNINKIFDDIRANKNIKLSDAEISLHKCMELCIEHENSSFLSTQSFHLISADFIKMKTS